MQVNWPPLSLGSVLATVVLILVILLCILGKMPVLEASLFGLLALARLV